LWLRDSGKKKLRSNKYPGVFLNITIGSYSAFNPWLGDIFFG